MPIKKLVWTTLQFTGFHYFQGAEGKEAYLRHVHRHVFHVKAGVYVEGLNREVEFIELKRKVTDFVRERYEDKTWELSCEMLAAEIMEGCWLDYCSVSEDGESGATLWRAGEPGTTI
jgi:hypothetical protein